MTDYNVLKETFIKAATLHGEGTISGDHKLCNTQYYIILDAYKKLFKDEEGQKILQQLMYYPNQSVQSWAAYYMLQIYPQEAVNVLKHVEKSKDLVGFSAKITLQQWEKGKLKFPEL